MKVNETVRCQSIMASRLGCARRPARKQGATSANGTRVWAAIRFPLVESEVVLSVLLNLNVRLSQYSNDVLMTDGFV